MSDELWKQYMGECRHFDGLFNKKCKMGVEYESVRDVSTTPFSFPCFSERRGSTVCALASYITEEEAKAMDEESRQMVIAYFAAIEGGICPTCKQPMKERQVRRCVYAEPCGHRLYQGRVSKR